MKPLVGVWGEAGEAGVVSGVYLTAPRVVRTYQPDMSTRRPVLSRRYFLDTVSALWVRISLVGDESGGSELPLGIVRSAHRVVGHRADNLILRHA